MNNKKQTIKPEKRRALYIEYLKKHNGASTSDFLNYLTVNYSYKTSGNTLCEDRKYLEQLGYKFDVINNVYHLVYVPENLNNFSFNSCINQNLFLDWQLLKEITSQKVTVHVIFWLSLSCQNQPPVAWIRYLVIFLLYINKDTWNELNVYLRLPDFHFPTNLPPYIAFPKMNSWNSVIIMKEFLILVLNLLF